MSVRDRLRVPRETVQELGRSFPVSDVALWAAGASFFGIMGLVPLALVALRCAAALVGGPEVVSGMAVAAGALPRLHGTQEALAVLTETAVGMSWVQTAVALFPAGLYGEGLRRAFRQLVPVEDRFTGWRGRLGLLPVVVVAPVLVLALLAAAPVVAPMYERGGWWLLLGIVIAFHAVWLTVSVALLLVFRVVAPGHLGWRALLWGAFGCGSFLAGFLQGFVLFLAIPVEWSLPFGGLPVFGAVAALALWLYILHVLLLTGYRATLVLDARFRE